jgi:hypothetical protein
MEYEINWMTEVRMQFFIKLNTISALYALALFIAIELIINVSHISEVYGFEWDMYTLSLLLLMWLDFFFQPLSFLA